MMRFNLGNKKKEQAKPASSKSPPARNGAVKEYRFIVTFKQYPDGTIYPGSMVPIGMKNVYKKNIKKRKESQIDKGKQFEKNNLSVQEEEVY